MGSTGLVGVVVAGLFEMTLTEADALWAPGLLEGLTIGGVEIVSHGYGRHVEVVVAAPYAAIHCDLLAKPIRHVRFAEGCMVIAEQVWYRPVGFTDDGRSLVCELVRDA